MMDQSSLLQKYQKLVLIFSDDSNHPKGIINGVKNVCKKLDLIFMLENELEKLEPSVGDAYIFLTETEMAILIKKIRKTDLEMGSDIGLLSFNETILKELLGISVVSTDFKQMGQTAAKLILERDKRGVRNPFSFYERSSL